MTNTNAIKSVIATLNAMDIDDDLHDKWEAVHDAAEDLLLALEHDDEPALRGPFFKHEGTYGEFRA